jgi:hypothetical protein
MSNYLEKWDTSKDFDAIASGLASMLLSTRDEQETAAGAVMDRVGQTQPIRKA